VAGEAAIGENRPHVAIEVKFGVGRGGPAGERNRKQARKRKATAGGVFHKSFLLGEHPRRRSAATRDEKPAVKRGPDWQVDRRGSSTIVALDRNPAKLRLRDRPPDLVDRVIPPVPVRQ
jgi:hypothetical protein